MRTIDTRPSSDVAFTAAVKSVQERRGSRRAYRRMEENGGWRTTVTPDLVAFLAERDSVYLATSNLEGQPYIQHRGGPKGFIRVLDEKTLGFADYAGNRQYITIGNLSENDRALLFFMDYTNRRRIKIWGRARVVEDDPELLARLTPRNYDARPEQAILFTIDAWDINCPQHIPRKWNDSDVTMEISALQQRIKLLEAENARLRGVASVASSAKSIGDTP